MTARRALVLGGLAAALAIGWPAQSRAADVDTRLAEAARRGDAATVRRLLQQRGIDVNAPSADGTPALHWAVRVNDVETAAALIRAGANVRLPNRYGVLPLTLAAQNANAAMIRLLVESGADANAPDAAGETPLIAATSLGSLDAVRALVDAGAVVDARDKAFQQSALMVAVRSNHPPLARLFLDLGADVNARTRTGDTPRWVMPNSVPGFGHGIGIVRGGLPERGSRVPIPGAMSPLLYAARDGRRESAVLLLDRGANINQTDANGTTPLIMAIANNHPELAGLLIERGADIKAADWYGRTALWAAVEARNMDVDNTTFVNSVDRAPFLGLIQLLLTKGADVNARMQESAPIRRHMLPITGTLEWVDFTGQTSFVRAALAADLDVMRLLLKHGADPQIPTFGGTTALMAAAGVNWVVDQTYDDGPAARVAAVQLCFDLGLDVQAVNSMGLTALHGAANRGSDDIIRFLVGKGARLDAKDKEGRTPLTWAEGVFLATHPAVAKPTSIALIKSLMTSQQTARARGRPPMRHGVALTAMALVAIATASLGAGQTARSQAVAVAPQTPAIRPVRSSATAPGPDAAFVSKDGVTCHNARTKTGGLALDPAGLANVGEHVEVWEKVVRKLRTGLMPPSGMPRPDQPTMTRFTTALEAQLDRANPPGKHLDTPAFQRLNRVEYANAIRDLLALDVDTKLLLPGDDSSEGFDNIAEALTVSPSLVQAYVAAALKISRRALGDRSAAPAQITYSAPSQWVHDRHVEGLPLGTRGGVLVEHTFPLDAEYEFSIGGGGGAGGLAGAAIDITLDGAQLKVTNPRSFRQRVTAGPHAIGLALVDRQRGTGVDDPFSDHRTDAAFVTGGGVQTLTILGPFSSAGAGDTPSRQRILVCRPTAASDEPRCARQILTTLARRAYRRPPRAAEVDTLMAFYRQGREEGDFEIGLQQALARVLVAPAFLFRSEEPPATVASGTVYPISDLALASRLSFFLWSTIPDDQLLDLAVAGRLSNRVVLERQVRRMLADPKAQALIENFAGQWLMLRDLDTVQTEAPHFDDNLRRSFKRETQMLVEHIVREDRTLVDLLDADYTFADERLARHYGIPNVYGSYFRRVQLAADSPRRGVLGQGSVQTITSVSTRTSPVLRGKWVLENLLGAPPPEPPPGVEVNLDPTPGAAPTTLRQRLEMHRQNPVCASCHKIMDPIGFALENFDHVGEWREMDGPGRVDTTGQLADGTPLTGPADLRRAVLSRTDAFMTVAAEKLLAYAIGRPMLETDMSAVREVVRRADLQQNRFSSLVLAVAQSAPFRMRIKKG